MRRNKLLLSVVLTVLTFGILFAVAMPAVAQDPGEGEIELVIEPVDDPPEPGEEQTYDVIIEAPDNGVLAYDDIFIEVGDTAVGEITDFQEQSNPDLSNAEIQDDGATLFLSAATIDAFEGPADSYTIANVTITADAAAAGETTDLTFDENAGSAVADDDDEPYDIVGFEGAAFSVEDPLVDIELDVTDELVFGEQESDTYEVTATFASGATVDVTDDADVSSSDENIVSVDEETNEISAVSEGEADVTAAFEGETDTQSVTVEDPLAEIDLAVTDTLIFGEQESDTYEVTAIFGSGDTEDVTGEAVVSSANENIVSVDEDANEIAAEADGTADVTAEFEGESETQAVTVEDPVAEIELDVTDELVFGGQESDTYEVTATFESGETADVTDDADVSSADESVVSVDEAVNEISAVGAGSADVTAAFEGESETQSVTVEDPVAEIALDVTDTLVFGEQESDTYAVTATFESGETADVTDDADVSSADVGVVSVDEGANEIAAEGDGTADVTAELNGETDTQSVTVEDPLAEIDLAVTDTLVFGEQESDTYEVTAIFGSGDTEDVTGEAVVSSADESVVTVDDEVNEISAVSAGTADVTAALDGETDTQSVTVEDPVAEIALDVTDTLVFGEQESDTYEVTATFVSGATADVTDDADVSSADESVISVEEEANEISAVSEGTTDVTATFDGETDTQTVTVEDPIAEIDLAVTDELVFGEQESDTYAVTATFESGATEDVTDAAAVTSNETGVVSVDDEATEIAAEGDGTAAVTAAFDGETDTQVVTVVDPLVAVELAVEDELIIGDAADYTVTATFESGATDDVTDDADVNSDDETVVEVDAENTEIEAVGEGEAVVTAAFDGAEDDVTVTVEDAVTELSLAVETSLEIGDIEPYTVTATFASGETEDVTAEASVSSENTDVVAVDEEANEIEGVGEGTVQLTATFDGQTDTTTVSVADEVESIELDVTDELVVGDTAGYTVTATFTSGDTQDVTDDAAVSSSDTAVLTVDEEANEIEGSGGGSADVTAEFDGETDTQSVTVEDAVTDIELDVDDGLVIGDTAEYTVTATFASGDTEDVTDEAAVTSDDESVVTVDEAATQIEAVAEGTAGVTADFEGESDTVTVAVEDEVVDVELDVDDELVIGESAEYTVTATFASGETEDVTEQAAVTSDDESVVEVDAENTEVEAVGEGSAGVTAEFEEESDTVTVAVEDEVVDVELGVDDELVIGDTADYTVTATFASGDTEDVTDEAAVTSDDESVVEVDTENTEIEAIAEGTADVTASFQEESDSVTVTVQDEVVDVELEVDEELVIGDTADYTVTATFASGETEDVTEQATVTSDNESVIDVDETATEIEAVAEGTADVTAAFEEESDTVTVTVQDEVVDVELDVDEELVIGDSTDYTVTATFASGDTQDVTEQAAVTSDDEAVVDVNTESAEIEAVAEGTADVTAEFEGESDSVTVTVEDELVSVTLDVGNELAIGETADYTVTATFASGETENITTEATVASDDDSIITVDENATEIEAVGEGTTQVTATFEEGSDTVTVSVADELVDIELAVDDELVIGETVSYTVTATFASGDTQDVTDEAAVTSADESVVEVDTETNEIEAVGVSSTDVTAAFNGESDSVTVTVEDELVSVELDVEDALDIGETTSYTVTATFASGETEEITEEATVTSDDETVVAVDENATEIEAVGEGSADVTAAFDGESDTQTVSVEDGAVAVVVEALDIAGQGSDATIAQGDDEAVAVNVTNDGETPSSFEVTVEVGSQNETVETAELGAGETETVTVSSVTDELDIDFYDVSVSAMTEELTGELLVSVDLTGDGNVSTDTTGDGLLNDITGDGELSIADVQALFLALDDDRVQANAALFDFARANPERVSIFDVQGLFTQQEQTGGTTASAATTVTETTATSLTTASPTTTVPETTATTTATRNVPASTTVGTPAARPITL